MKKTTPDLHDETLAGTVITDQEHRARLDRYSRAKRHQVTVTDYIQHDPEMHKEHKALSECGQYLMFKHWKLTNFRRLVGGFSCKKHLLCWPCGLRRDSRQICDYSLKVQQILSENPGLVPVLITRTVKNGFYLSERYAHLVDIHKTLITWRRRSLSARSGTRGRSADSVMQHIVGSVGTCEFGRGKDSDLWHPHIHEIAFLEPGVFEFFEEREPGWDRDENGEWRRIVRTVHVPREFRSRLAQEYWMISGDSYIVDVRRIDCFDGDLLKGDDPDSVGVQFDEQKLVKALCEVFKYALKFNELSLEDQIHAYKTLKGRRLIFSYGCLRGVKVDESLIDSGNEELEIGPYVYELYRFVRNEYALQRHLDSEEFEEMQETAAMKARRARLNAKEDRIDRERPVLLKNGLCIDGEKIRKHLEAGEAGEPVPF